MFGFSLFQDMKNAELALFELSRVISLEPDHPEVLEQRAEVSIFCLSRLLEKLQLCSVSNFILIDLMAKAWCSVNIPPFF